MSKAIGVILDADGRSWFAVYTKPRQERIALENLERQSFECFLPMVKTGTQHRTARNQARHEPLFSRYVFLRADHQQQSLGVVRSTRGAVGLVSAGFELVTICDSIIAGLKARVDPADGLVPIDSCELSDGDKVRVFSGPFAALEGVFRESRGAMRSLLLLKILGRETAVEIDSRLLQRAT